MNIQRKLILSFIITCTLLISAMYALMQWSFDRGLLEYVNQRNIERHQQTVEALKKKYATTGSWAFIQHPKDLHNIVGRTSNSNSAGAPPFKNGGPPPRHMGSFSPPVHKSWVEGEPHGPETQHIIRPHSPPEISLLDKDKTVIVGWRPPEANEQLLTITLKGGIIGWLSVPKNKAVSEAFDLQFMDSLQTTFTYITVFTLLLSFLAAFPLARHFIGPIRTLARNAHQLTQGKYDVETISSRSDELGQLIRDFNQLAFTLDKNHTARRRWLADISHELRTPIAILKGEIEAIIDGIRPNNTNSLHSLQDETDHLQRLVEDLYELTNTDIGALQYRKSHVELIELLEDTTNKHQTILQKHNIELSLKLPEPVNKETIQECWTLGDETRLQQLLDNLLTNSRKYTDSNGNVTISLTGNNQNIYIDIHDSAPGVPAESIDKLFDHLYRVEKSRNRQAGGSGLGLAICKQIVEAHEGCITAQASPLGGLWIRIQLKQLTVTNN